MYLHEKTIHGPMEVLLLLEGLWVNSYHFATWENMCKNTTVWLKVWPLLICILLIKYLYLTSGWQNKFWESEILCSCMSSMK